VISTGENRIRELTINAMVNEIVNNHNYKYTTIYVNTIDDMELLKFLLPAGTEMRKDDDGWIECASNGKRYFSTIYDYGSKIMIAYRIVAKGFLIADPDCMEQVVKHLGSLQ